MQRKDHWNGLRLLIGWAVLSLLLSFCNRLSDPLHQLQQANYYLNHNDSVEYVGMQVCRECHPQQYASYIRTGMGQSFDSATPLKSAAVFGPDSILHDPHGNLSYRPFWVGDTMKILEYRIESGERVHARTERIDYIVGSGQHTNSHIHLSGAYAYQAPFTYYTQEQRLDLPPGFEEGKNSRFSRKIGLECMTCHNGYPEMVLGSENKYTFIPDGIDCERCHGPGEVHVLMKKKGFVVDTAQEIDYSIVNPAKLSKERQTDLCARCHLQGTMVIREGKSFYDFKPGHVLDSVMDIFMPVFEGGKEDFIMASHYERMVQSSCHVHSGGQFTCLDCHNPHISRSETPVTHYNKVCIGCHSVPGRTCAEQSPARKNVNDNCVLCHMREGQTRDIPHVWIHDHKISIPPEPEEMLGDRKFLGLTSINNPGTDALQKARGYLLEFESFHPDPHYLDSALYFLEQVSEKTSGFYFNALVNYYFLKKEYPMLQELVTRQGLRYVLDSLLVEMDFSNYDAWTAYRIGQAFENTGNMLVSGYFYEKATILAPYVLEFQNHYGSQLVNEGELEKAQHIFEFILHEDPGFVQAYINLGYIYVKLNRFEEGKSLYNEALSLNPDNRQALLNLGAVYFIEGNTVRADHCINRLLVLDPTNRRAHQLKQQIITEKNEKP